MSRPYLLTYLLGKAYVSSSQSFRQVWDEVRTKRTLLTLLEMIPETVPLPARFEVVVTDTDASSLSTARHRRLSRAIVRGGLLVKVSKETQHIMYLLS